MVGGAIVDDRFIGKGFTIGKLLIVVAIYLHFENDIIPRGMVLHSPKHGCRAMKKLPSRCTALIARTLIPSGKILPKGSHKGIGHIIAGTQLPPAHTQTKVKIIMPFTGDKIFSAK